MKKVFAILILLAAFLALGSVASSRECEIMVFCGAAFKKPMEEISGQYQKQTGCRINATYAGVGTLFSQILLSKRGDVFLVPSEDIMERAKGKGIILGKSIRNVAYIVPSINTQKNNPKGIRTVHDLAKPGIRVGLADPEIVYIGAIAKEILEKNMSADDRTKVMKNVVTIVEDFNKLATLLILKQVDAVIGFHFLEGWYPDKISTIKFKNNEILRIGAVQAATIEYSAQKSEAEKFLQYLNSEQVKIVFRKYHYFGTVEEAFAWAGGRKPVGGGLSVPKDNSTR